MRLNIKLINCNYSHDLYWPRILARPVDEAWRRRHVHCRVAKEFLFRIWFFGSSTISRKNERINYTKFDYDCCTKQAALHRLNVLLIFLAFLTYLLPLAFCWVSCTRGTSVLFSQLQVRVESRRVEASWGFSWCVHPLQTPQSRAKVIKITTTIAIATNQMEKHTAAKQTNKSCRVEKRQSKRGAPQ